MADNDPVSLVEEANAIVSLLLALKQEVKPHEKATALVNELSSRALRVAAVAHSIREAARDLEGAKRTETLAALERQLTIDAGVSLDVFFREVATAVIKAQRSLDERAERELAAPADRNRIPPVQYAIPSVHAQMKVGFSQVSSRGVNLLVFNNQQQKQNYSESTISFDIVAAHATPKQARLKPPPEGEPGEAPPLESADVVLPPADREVTGRRAVVSGEPEFDTGFLESVLVSLPPPPAFPLQGPARDEALRQLLAAVSAGERSRLDSESGTIVIVPSELDPSRGQSLMYLVPGETKKNASRVRRAFRIYLGDVQPSGELVLRRPQRPDVVDAAGRAYRGQGLLVPPGPIPQRDAEIVPAVAGGVGAALMHVVQAARTFHPGWTAPSPTVIETINRRLSGVPPLGEPDTWAVLTDPGARGPQSLEWLVLRPVLARGREWSELHVVGVPRNPKRRPKTPHVHIPAVDVLEEWRSSSRPKLLALGKELEPLLRRLSAIIAHAGR